MGAPEATIAGSSYEVRDFSVRRIAAARSHEWHVAARLGPQYRGGATKYLGKAAETPPAIRRPPPQGIAFSAGPQPNQRPASMNTDASLGFSRAGYQSSYVALELRDGNTGALRRTEGTSSRGSEALRGNPTRGGEVGF